MARNALPVETQQGPQFRVLFLWPLCSVVRRECESCTHHTGDCIQRTKEEDL